ncbi:MAG TPA: hypothetical protein ENG00_01060 [Candidatus Aenigmarchaeota archaeon]|nr:hypothetical protein [Candidatus Aenigmarchaeota archaeon]
MVDYLNGSLEEKYLRESKDYEARCQVLARIAKELQNDVDRCKYRIKAMQRYSDKAFLKGTETKGEKFFLKLYNRIKSSLGKLDRKPLEHIIEDDVRTLGKLKNALYEKITLAENEIQTAEERIDRLYQLEREGIERIRKNKERLKRAESELKELEMVMAEETEIMDLADREKKLKLDQEMRLKKVEIGNYESQIISDETVLNQIRNLREAYKLLVDKGISLALKNAKTAYLHITQTHDALKNITSGKIALSGLVTTTTIALAGLVNIREDMNYIFDVIVGTASKLPEAIPVLKEPFYDEKMLKRHSRELREGERKFKSALKTLTEDDDIIEYKVVPNDE